MSLRSYAVRFVLLLVILNAALAGLLHAQGLPGAETAPARLELLDPLSDIVLPRLYPVIAADVSPSLGDATLINRINVLVSLAMVDAAAPYHETAVGMYTRLPRRPESERSDRNINTSMLHAAFQTLIGLLPDREPVWREMLLDFGLNPDDASTDTSSAAGIGNVAGAGALAGRLYDGMNQTGDYQDTTGYVPVNSAFALRDPSRWQPGLRLQGTGVYSVQHFVTPQLANTEPVAEFNPRSLRVPIPSASNVDNWQDYKEQADAVLEVSANLTDEQKLMAELFDNKIVSLGLSYIHLGRELNLSPADMARGYFVKVAAALDSSIVIWQEKARYDAVRPFSAIRHIYGDDPVRAWAGPGAGAAEIPASAWQSYLPEADHPEYPSGSTCGCYATAQAVRRFTGSDELNWSVSYPAGASRIEPGLTPARDLTLHFATWTDFAENCGQARVWAGVHFPAAVEASAAICSRFGDYAYDYYAALMDGSAPLREAASELEADPWLPTAAAASAPALQAPKPTTPTPEACQAVSDSALVTSVNSGIECRSLDTSGLRLLTGFLDAVEISGAVDLGAQVCFRDSGALVFFDESDTSPRLTEVTTYQVSDLTCGWFDQAGTVVLVASRLPLAAAANNGNSPAVLLSNCKVATTTRVNFRPAPAASQVTAVVPANLVLTATAKSAGWYNVLFGGDLGWISAAYVDTEGVC